jgi:hypothetical protein
MTRATSARDGLTREISIVFACAPWYVIAADDKPFARVAAAGEGHAPPGAEPDRIEVGMAAEAAGKKAGKGKKA